MNHALLREVPDTFDQAIVRHGSPQLDVDKARSQHLEYVRLIEDAGYKITTLPADHRHPDCLFVEDTVVVIGETALITRPGAESRRGEVPAVANALKGQLDIVHMTAPATMDGGDVFRMGDTIYVGRSKRTNDAGITQLAKVADRTGLQVVPMDVAEVLHLKSAIHPIDQETVVVTTGTVDESLLDGWHVLHEDEEERHRFSSLILRTGAVVVTEVAPATNESIAALGFDLIPIDVSEIQAADGGLTCMSVLY